MPADPLKRAMLKYAPQLARDYTGLVKSVLKRLQKNLGPGLPGIYNKVEARVWNGLVRANVKPKREPYTFRDIADWTKRNKANESIPFVIDSTKLKKNGKKYGEATALAWYHKMLMKAGFLTGVKVVMKGGDLTVTGTHQGDKIRIEQQTIINFSSLGTPFHQFPARIYMNGKFVSEAAYKKLTPSAKRPPPKPKKAPIDPLSRPRQYHFEYKVDHRKDMGGRAPQGVSRDETVWGMSEKEAWEKLWRREMPKKLESRFYSKVYDPVLTRIWAWNHVLLWKKGQPRPKGL